MARLAVMGVAYAVFKIQILRFLLCHRTNEREFAIYLIATKAINSPARHEFEA